MPEGHTAQTYLRQLCEEGLKFHYGEHADDPEVRKRLEYELSVIHDMGFDAYFLIVWDLCCYARSTGIWYNARGSGAGSMVAYTLYITTVEPLGHGLIFERFLNPGRISMPDIDLDFQDDKRSMMMEYCAHKYGEDRVAQIITFGTLGARAAIRDVGRVMDIPLNEVDRVSKQVPNIPGKPVSIAEALETVPDFKKIYEEAPYLKDLIDTAANMEGSVRNAGTHAAGVIIADRPIIDYVPLHRPTSNSEESPIKMVTQFEMSIVESLGLLKVDFLGLSTLTIMQRACDLIEERTGIQFNLNNIPVDELGNLRVPGQRPYRRCLPTGRQRHDPLPDANAPEKRGQRHRYGGVIPPRPAGVHPGLHPAHARRGAGRIQRRVDAPDLRGNLRYPDLSGADHAGGRGYGRVYPV